MEYRRFGSKIVVRLDRWDELCSKLLELAELENISLAAVSGIGAADDITLGVFNPRTKKYTSTRYEGDFEIASVTGNLSRQDGKPYLHLHAVIGDPATSTLSTIKGVPKGIVYGGHLNSARISATGEIIVDVIDGEVGRKFSEDIGLNLFEF